MTGDDRSLWKRMPPGGLYIADHPQLGLASHRAKALTVCPTRVQP